MFAKPITYEDFNEVQHTEVFYFNISKPEIVKMQVEYKDGLAGMLQEIVDTKDNKRLVEIFERIILQAYGEKSEDGKHFEKSDELRARFSQTGAYISLFTEMMTVEGAAIEFFQSVLPLDMREEFKKAIVEVEKTTPVPVQPVPNPS